MVPINNGDNSGGRGETPAETPVRPEKLGGKLRRAQRRQGREYG